MAPVEEEKELIVKSEHVHYVTENKHKFNDEEEEAAEKLLKKLTLDDAKHEDKKELVDNRDWEEKISDESAVENKYQLCGIVEEEEEEIRLRNLKLDDDDAKDDEKHPIKTEDGEEEGTLVARGGPDRIGNTRKTRGDSHPYFSQSSTSSTDSSEATTTHMSNVENQLYPGVVPTNLGLAALNDLNRSPPQTIAYPTCRQKYLKQAGGTLQVFGNPQGPPPQIPHRLSMDSLGQSPVQILRVSSSPGHSAATFPPPASPANSASNSYSGWTNSPSSSSSIGAPSPYHEAVHQVPSPSENVASPGSVSEEFFATGSSSFSWKDQVSYSQQSSEFSSHDSVLSTSTTTTTTTIIDDCGFSNNSLTGIEEEEEELDKLLREQLEELDPMEVARILENMLPIPAAAAAAAAITVSSGTNVPVPSVPVAQRVLHHHPQYSNVVNVPTVVSLLPPVGDFTPVTVSNFNAAGLTQSSSSSSSSSSYKSKAAKPPSKKGCGGRQQKERLILPKPTPSIPPPPVAAAAAAAPVAATRSATSTINKEFGQHPSRSDLRNALREEILGDLSEGDRRALNMRVNRDLPAETVFGHDEDGDTPLMIAIAKKSVAISVYLIDRLAREQPAKLNHANKHGHTALYSAALLSQTEILKYLILSGADPNAIICRRSGNAVLHCLAQRGSACANVITALCEFAEVRVDARNCDGMTALLLAVKCHGKSLPVRLADGTFGRLDINSLPVVEVLLKRQGSLEMECGKNGHTALHEAIRMKNITMLETIVTKSNWIRQCVDIPTFYLNTPLHYAAGLSELTPDEQVQIIKLLLSHGASKEKRNNEDKLPVELVPTERKPVKQLLQISRGRRSS